MQINTSCEDYDSINQHSNQSTRTTGPGGGALGQEAHVLQDDLAHHVGVPHTTAVPQMSADAEKSQKAGGATRCRARILAGRETTSL